MRRGMILVASPRNRPPKLRESEESHNPRGTPKRPGRSVIVLAALTALAILCVLAAAAGSHGRWMPTTGPEREAPRPARLVKAVQVPPARATLERSFPGVTEAARQMRLAFRVAGPIDRFDVKVGQHVRQGELLARIDPRDFRVALTQAEAHLAEARAGLKAMRSGARAEDLQALEARLQGAQARRDEARRNFERVDALYDARTVAQAQFEAAQAAFEVAQAAVEAAEQELEKARNGARLEEIEGAEAQIAMLQAQRSAAENALADTELRAPVEGYVAQKFAEAYETVAAGQPVVTLLECSTVEVTVGIPEDVVTLQDRFERFRVELDAYPGRRYDARLHEIGPAIQLGKLSYPLTVRMEAPAGCVVRPGMTATVHIQIAEPPEEPLPVVLPLASVFRDAEGCSAVWAVDRKTGTVHRRKVTLGGLASEGVRITSGLAPGTWVVVAGADFLHEGQKVRLQGA